MDIVDLIDIYYLTYAAGVFIFMLLYSRRLTKPRRTDRNG